ncbi:MAG: MBL fold metallo-hydrolase [Defluviitaleaceae bacterium]|nr:MBL fold metallo-hydrolase [Defluviitaleaceae bacterium]
MSGWFKVVELSNRVFAIMEPFHFQEVISYLIIGKKSALLFDTGAGIGNIREIVNTLWDGEVIVVNSHIHFDHIGNNHLFKEVLVYNCPEALDRLKKGYSAAELAPHNKPNLFAAGYFEKFAKGDYHIPPCNPYSIEDEHIIDLGGRIIKIIHTPGHSPDSIMLLDMENKMLFTGDTYYPGHLYAHYEGKFYGNSQIETYADSLEKVGSMVDKLLSVHPGHNDPVVSPDMLKKAAHAMRRLANRKISPGEHLFGDLSLASLPDSGENVEGYVIPDDLYVYNIDGVKIIARKRH